MKYIKLDTDTHKNYVELHFDEDVIILHRDEARTLALDLWNEFGEISWT